MSHWLGFLLVTALLSLTQANEKKTACANLKPAFVVNITDTHRWYCCKSSAELSYGICYTDTTSKGDLIYHNNQTRYNKETKELEVVTWTDDDNEPSKNGADDIDLAMTSDENCLFFVRCIKDGTAPFAIFSCRTKEACKGDQHMQLLEETIAKVKAVKGMEEFRSEMKDSYNEEICKE